MTPFARLFLLLVLIAASLGWTVSASAQDLPPRPDGPVYDGADLLSPDTEAQLDQYLREYNRETGRALIVATIPSLNGEAIEPYATRLFSTWGIGGAERDLGLLLLIARDDREMRIEIGYGLHPYFGGIIGSRVIADTIRPRFLEGNFDAGVIEGIDAITTHLANSPEDAIAIEEAAKAAQEQRSRSDGGFPVGALIWLGFMFFFFVLPIIRGARRRRRYRTKGKGPWGKRRKRGGDLADDVADVASNVILWEIGSAIARGAMSGGGSSGGGWGGGGSFGGGGGGFGGFGGGMSGGGGASGGW